MTFCPYPICLTLISLILISSLSYAMTPVFLNSAPSPKFPFVELKEEHHDPKLFLSVNKYEGGSSDQQQASSSSSSSIQPTVDHNTTNGQDSSFGSAGDNMGISVKWMSSKMRLMKKMTDSDHNNNNKAVKFKHKFQYPMQDYNGENNYLGKANNNTIRVCSDCNTTTTPLWRSGPRGPKSLCNACGIRQRKARRAMEAAAAATVAENSAGVAKEAPISMKIKIHNTNNNKEKKPRIGQLKKQQFKSASDNYNSPYNNNNQQTQKKLFFKEFALSLSNNSSALQRVFPQDVEDAAILLMELSCGLIHS